jgi:hypothetical protein
MCPKSLPYGIEKWDFLGFKEIPYLLHFWKIFSRCCQCSSFDLEKIVMSSKYMIINFPSSPTKVMSMAL